MTHFQPNFARRVFPCFDDPNYHSKFQLNVVRESDENIVALSNTHIERETHDFPEKNLITSHFAKTRPIPIHMLAFTIGKFAYIPSTPTPAGLYIAAYTRNDLVDETEQFREMALGIAAEAEKLFYLKIPVPKLDFIGVPRTILTLENIGLITMEEKFLMLSEKITAWDHMKTEIVTATEIANVWLSSYVLIKMWDDFWLKVGLAGFLGHILVELYHTDFSNLWIAIATKTFAAMRLDGHLESYPISEEGFKKISISKLYKTLRFNKSMAVVLMVFYGRLRIFRNILYKYFLSETVLSAPKFYSITEQILKFNPAPIFDSFTRQKGYPVLDVRSFYGQSYLIEQRSFVNNKYSKRNPAESKYHYRWNIPIYYICETNPKKIRFLLMDTKQKKVTIEIAAGNWILLNHRHVGYYRVNYSLEKWANFAHILMKKPEVFEPEDIAGLIEDAFCLAHAGYFHYNVPFNLTVYLHFHKELNAFPWRIVSKNLYDILYHFLDTPGVIPFLMYARSLLKGTYNENIWKMEDDSIMDKITKTEILNLGCWAEDAEILEKAREFFIQWLDLNATYNPNILQIILKYGMHTETSAELWERVFRRYKRLEQNDENKDLCWTALASAKKSDLIADLLEHENQNLHYLSQADVLRKRIKPLICNHYAAMPLWNFLKKNVKFFLSQKLITRQTYRRFVSDVVSKLNDEAKLKEVNIFLNEYPLTTCMKRAIESLQNNLNWKKAYYDVMCEWLHLYVTGIEEETAVEVEEEQDEILEEIAEEEEKNDDY
ncbi:hypothetical protein O3M35_009407 [Rhynocoris fuscipes]|uniref:Aminopeptidase n=1 Tax=Rhynocoris fuscipes TaxID=488301 RepID=A0AAW1D2T2_9HEMI